MEDNTSYDVTRAEYDQAYCLENMVDYSESLVRTPAVKQLNGGSVSEPARYVVGVSGPGKVLYERYFPYVLLVQALVCACPLLIWQLYSTEILSTSVTFIGEGLKDLENKTEKENEETGSEDKSENTKEARKENSPATRLEEIKQQVNYWSTQTNLTKLYVTKLLLHEMFLILIICFYLCFDMFYGLSFKSDFVCYVNKKVLVNCDFPGASVLRIFWLANLAVVDFALLLNTIQLINITWCMRKRNRYFFQDWSHGGVENKGNVIANDARLISAICHENLSVLPSRGALRAIQEPNTKKSEEDRDIPEIITQSKSLDSLPESESSFCTAPRPSQAGLPGEAKQYSSSNGKLISDV